MFYREEDEVIGGMATSRTLGDLPYKDVKFGFISDAETFNEDFSEEKFKFLIMASDGLWDAFKSEEAVNFINLKKTSFVKKGYHKMLRDYTPIEEVLAKNAETEGSSDNITVMIIKP